MTTAAKGSLDHPSHPLRGDGMGGAQGLPNPTRGWVGMGRDAPRVFPNRPASSPSRADRRQHGAVPDACHSL
jgi:hypothetical protein